MSAQQSKWVDILSPAEIEAQHALTATLDPSFADADRKWWQSRTVDQLRVEMAIAWDIASSDSYQRARSYLAMKGVAA